jgi:ParB/RepB/Spo0J family partition protein
MDTPTTIRRAPQPSTRRFTTPPVRAEQGGAVAALPVTAIGADPGRLRTEFASEGLVQLAGSLVRHGQLQPITVRRGPEPGRYTIVCGERRWRAAALANLPTLKAVILDGPPDPALDLERQLVENSLREELTLLDQARAFRALMVGHGWSARRLAQALRVSHTTVQCALALLDLQPTGCSAPVSVLS